MASRRNRTHLVDTAEQCADLLTVSQVSVGTGSGVQLLASNLGRRAALITNQDSTNPVYIGTTTAVTSATGHKLAAGLSMSITYNGVICAIATGGTVTVSASEIYDPLSGV